MIIDPPEDGWTLELLNQVVYMNGEHITFPIGLDELLENENYSIEESESIEGVLELFLHDEFVSVISYELSNKNIHTIMFPNGLYEPDQDFNDYISINGVKLGIPMTELEKYLGNYDVEEKGVYRFYVRSNTEPRVMDITIAPHEEKTALIMISEVK